MVSDTAVLLVDAGNSRIKSVALADVKDSEPLVHTDAYAFINWLPDTHFSHIFLSNVGKKDI